MLSGLIEARALETFINLHPSASAGDKTLAEERNKAYFLFLFFVHFSVRICLTDRRQVWFSRGASEPFFLPLPNNKKKLRFMRIFFLNFGSYCFDT